MIQFYIIVRFVENSYACLLYRKRYRRHKKKYAKFKTDKCIPIKKDNTLRSQSKQPTHLLAQTNIKSNPSLQRGLRYYDSTRIRLHQRLITEFTLRRRFFGASKHNKHTTLPWVNIERFIIKSGQIANTNSSRATEFTHIHTYIRLETTYATCVYVLCLVLGSLGPSTVTLIAFM